LRVTVISLLLTPREQPTPDDPFTPNLVNTVVFLIMASLQARQNDSLPLFLSAPSSVVDYKNSRTCCPSVRIWTSTTLSPSRSFLSSSSLYFILFSLSSSFLISVSLSLILQVVNFIVNYEGLPHMQSMRENKGLYYSLLISVALVVLLATETSTDLNSSFELVILPPALRDTICLVLFLNAVACFSLDRLGRLVLS